MRAGGFLLGTLLIPAILVLVLSRGTSPTAVQEGVSSAGDTAPRITGTEAPPDTSVEFAVDKLPSAAAHATGHDAEPRPDVRDSAPQSHLQLQSQSRTNREIAGRNDVEEVSRYRVWSPFHNERAAQGFARRLALATGVPVEVIDEAPGNHQVVFSYRDDDELQAMVKRIETVTGLELEQP